VSVVALAHPKEVRTERDVFTRVGPLDDKCPIFILARPLRSFHGVLVTDVRREIVLFDDLVEVIKDRVLFSEGRTGPGFEAIAVGVEVAVRARSGVSVRPPRAAVSRLCLENDEALVRALLNEMMRTADARDSCTHDQDVKVL
jgi:hypothetical protein